MDLHHPLYREFPEHRETIKRLKAGDDRFRQMFEEYHTLAESIYRIEEEIDFATDQEIEDLKIRRVWLKDQLYRALLRGTAPPPVPATATVTARSTSSAPAP